MKKNKRKSHRQRDESGLVCKGKKGLGVVIVIHIPPIHWSTQGESKAGHVPFIYGIVGVAASYYHQTLGQGRG